MGSGSHKYLANEALALIFASDNDSNDLFGDESSLDSSNSHYSRRLKFLFHYLLLLEQTFGWALYASHHVRSYLLSI